MKRIQRKRTKGWRMPENTISITRPGKWGNPLKVVDGVIYIDASNVIKDFYPWIKLTKGGLDEMLDLYELLLVGELFKHSTLRYWQKKIRNLNFDELRGKDLACFCADGEKCHGDYIIKHIKDL